ncbi:MAG: hypothetical protein WCH62_08795, partial [Candidatus Omnitrophota bacterium]
NVVGILEWINTNGLDETGSKMVLKKILGNKEYAKSVMDWVETRNANEEVIGSLIRILVKDDYLDNEGLKMFLDLLVKTKNAEDAGIFLAQVEQLQGAFNGLKFNKAKSEIRAETIVKIILSSKDVDQLLSGLNGLMSSEEFEWSKEFYLQGQDLIEDVVGINKSVEQIGYLIREGVLSSIGEIIPKINQTRSVKNPDPYGYNSYVKRKVFSQEFKRNIFQNIVRSKEVGQRAPSAVEVIETLLKVKMDADLRERIITGLVFGKIDNGERVTRAVKIIQTLVKVKMKAKVRERIIEALAWSDLKVDVDGVLAKIISWSEKLSDTPGWDDVTKSIVTALEKGDYEAATDPRGMIKLVTRKGMGLRQGENVAELARMEGVEGADSSKRVLQGMLEKGITRDNVVGILEWVNTSGLHETGSKMVLKKVLGDKKYAKSVMDWVEARNANEEVIGRLARILVKDDYLDNEGFKIFLDILFTKTTKDAGVYLAQVEQLQGSLNGLKFNSGKKLQARAEALVKAILGNKEADRLLAGLNGLIGSEEFKWSKDFYGQARDLIEDIMSVQEPAKQAELLMEKGVMASIGELVSKMHENRRKLTEDFREDLLDRLVKSSEAQMRAVRALKVIDNLVNVELRVQVRELVIGIVVWAGREVDVDSIINLV